MAIRKTAQSITLNGGQLTPAGDVSMPLANGSWEGMDNLDGSTDAKFNATKEPAVIIVVNDEASRKLITAAAAITGWSMTVRYRDKSTAQVSNAMIEGIPMNDADGITELTIKGTVRWL